ncbi:MAG TPA: NAD(P)/FAD-dependent oxidoreductase [Gemmatimonadaceae bacterium]|jgi:thioredoxin reductase|nr:NAD(P)/FAD-dependent oxidoreductase [Gemmatimonadaceae bacterium]
MTNDKTPQDGVHYDVAIVGGGAAGLSAALWLARYLHTVVLVDSGDPRNWETRGVNGYLGLPRIRPSELRGLGRDECREHGVNLIDGTVLSVARESDDHFELQLEGGRKVSGRRLLLAIGLKDVWPDIPGLEHVYGKDAHVCPDCDGYEARDKKTVVIGKGRRAVGMALNLTTWTRDLTVCTNGTDADLTPELQSKLDVLGIPVITDTIVELKLRLGELRSLVFDPHCGREPLGVEEIFFSIGQYPADDLGVQLGCERDEQGHIIVDEHYCTTVPNVSAAGDIVPGPQLAICAAADGTIAALAIHKSLVPAERQLEPLPAVATTAR